MKKVKNPFLQEKGLSLEDMSSEPREGEPEELSETSSLRDAVNLAIPDDASSGENQN